MSGRLVLVMVLVLATLGNTQFNVRQTGKCRKQGTDCRIISQCPQMLQLVNKVKAGDREALSTLLSSRCGFFRSQPMVCCGKTPGKGRRIPGRDNTSSNLSSSSRRPASGNLASRPLAPSSRSPPQEDLFNLNHEKCGTRSDLGIRVTRGRTAAGKQFPWVAALIFRRGVSTLPLCGATLISRTHLLTAAHCTFTVSGYSLDTARLGQTDIGGSVETPGVQVDISSIVRHPQFRQDPLVQFDLAILRLAVSVRFSDFIRPICLEGGSTTGELVVAGWGRTHTRDTSNTLQYTSLVSVPSQQCEAEYREAVLTGRLGQAAAGLEVLPSMVCARGRGGRDSCTGDSGGPLMARGQDRGLWYLEGIVSYGTQECDSSLPGVYTRISPLLPWIRRTLEGI